MKINDASFITEQPESKTIFEQKKSMIINSSDYNSNMNSFTPTHSSYNSKFTSTTCKTPTMKSKEGANFTHRGSVAYDYKNRIYSGFNNEQTNTNQENSILFNKSNNMTKYDKSITIEGEMNNDEDQKDHSTIKKRRKSRAERNQRKSKSKEKYSPLNSKNQNIKFPTKVNQIIGSKNKNEHQSELEKRRKQNEENLEELESCVFENIKTTRNIINRNSSLNSLKDSKQSTTEYQCEGSIKISETETPKGIYKDTKFAEFKKQSQNCIKPNYRTKIDNKEIIKTKRNDEISYSTCDVKNSQSIKTEFINNDNSLRKSSVISKKYFKEDKEDKDVFECKVASCFSFTNQTDMFDNYDSNNSTYSNKFHEVTKGDMNVKNNENHENLKIKVSELPKSKNSFVNLTTPKNLFYNNLNQDENSEPIDQPFVQSNNSFGVESTINSKRYLSSTPEVIDKGQINIQRNQFGKENTYLNFLSKETKINKFGDNITENTQSRNDLLQNRDVHTTDDRIDKNSDFHGSTNQTDITSTYSPITPKYSSNIAKGIFKSSNSAVYFDDQGSPKKFNSGIYDSSVSGSYAASIRQRYASINNQ